MPVRVGLYRPRTGFSLSVMTETLFCETPARRILKAESGFFETYSMPSFVIPSSCQSCRARGRKIIGEEGFSVEIMR